MKAHETTMSSIRLRGHKALFDALGPVGFARFMQQFVARGDYTKERDRWIAGADLSDLKQRAASLTKKRRRKAV